jgi:hypothetical protein
VISPYVTGGPVTGADFYGRQELLDEITAGRCRATYVLGTRQIGKTSLLRQIETLVSSMFLDLQWAGGRLEDLVRQGQREVRRKRRHYPWLPPDGGLPDDLFRLLEVVNDTAEEAGERLWVLMDEAEIWARVARSDPGVLHRLRGIFQNCPALRVVLAASKSLSEANRLTGETGSPFLSGFALRYLGPLSTRDGAALLRQEQGSVPVTVGEELLTQLLALTGGHPLLLQLLGERLYEEGRLRPPTEGDLTGILDQAVKTGIFPQDFAALSEPERAILRAVSSGQPFPTDAHPTYLHGLVGLGILRREGDGYAIGNAFFARWLREQADWEAKAEVSAEGTLTVYTQSELEPVLAAVRENRLALAEMEQMLDAIRRALLVWQQKGMPGTERLAAALEKPGGPRHKLEATLPLLPGALAYKLEWGGEVRDLLVALRAASIHNGKREG